MDWKTLGNITTATLLGEVESLFSFTLTFSLGKLFILLAIATAALVFYRHYGYCVLLSFQTLCASYADYKYGRRSKDFKPDIEWKLVL